MLFSSVVSGPALSNICAAAFSPLNDSNFLLLPHRLVGCSQRGRAGADCGFSVWFWQRTSLPSQQQIGDFDLPALLHVFRKLTAFPRSHNCFYHTTLFQMAWLFTSWHHLSCKQTFTSVLITSSCPLCPRIPSVDVNGTTVL